MSMRGPRKCPRMDVSNNVHLCTHFEMSTRVDVVGVHGWTFLRSTRGHRMMSSEWTPKTLKPIKKKIVPLEGIELRSLAWKSNA
jgi:hypothetical protein